MRDLDAFEALVANEQVMSNISAEDRALLGNVLVQTPAYVRTLKAKYEEVWLPAEKVSDNEVLDAIRADPHRYQLSFSLDNESAKFFAPTLILCGRQDESVGYRDSLRLLELYPRSTYVLLDRGMHGLPIDETSVFEALVRDWIFRIDEWRSGMDKIRGVEEGGEKNGLCYMYVVNVGIAIVIGNCGMYLTDVLWDSGDFRLQPHSI